MTFYEAAVEVLRRSGRPLHFKKITEVAIRDELLSHVGKTPESTMEDRLDQETKKDDASWIVRTRPGVYMLRAEVAERLNEEARQRDEERRAERDRKRQEEAAAREAEEAEDSEAVDEVDDDEEEGDEELAADDAEDGEEGGRGRRRRRRRGRGRGRGRRGRDREDDSDEDAEAEAAAADDEADDGEAPAADDREGNGRKRRNGVEADASDKKRGRRRGGRSRRRRGSKDFEDLSGERCDSISDAAFAVLQANGRRPMSAADISGVVFDKKLVKFHTHDPEATIESAIVTDNQVRGRAGVRPVFAQYRDGKWGLTQWGVSDDGIAKEQQIHQLAAELRDEAQVQLADAVASLKDEAFEMVVMTLLERLDYRNLKVSKRSSEGDTYFSADWRRGFSDVRVCIQVSSDAAAALEADAITEMRDTLEHYGASEGVVIHLGEVSRDAVRESRNDEEAQVTVIDRSAFVGLLIDQGIGVRTFQTPLVMVDTAFVDALQR